MGEDESAQSLAERLAKIKSKIAYLTTTDEPAVERPKYSDEGFESSYSVDMRYDCDDEIKSKGSTSEGLEKAYEAVRRAHEAIEKGKRLGIENINVHTSEIELSSAKEALEACDEEQAMELASRIVSRMDKLMERVHHETTARALSNAYSVIASAKIYDISTKEESTKLDKASKLFMSDRYEEANALINEVISTVTSKRDEFLKNKIDKLFIETELVTNMLESMGLELHQLKESYEEAQSLYRRKHFADALVKAQQARQLAMTLKESFVGKYLTDLFNMLNKDIARAKELGIDTVKFEELEAQLHNLSHNRDTIDEIVDIEKQYKQALVNLETEISKYKDINLQKDMEELEELIFFATDLGVNLVEVNPKFEAIQIAYDRKDLNAFRKLKKEIISNVRPRLDAKYEALSKEAFIKVQETRDLLSDLEEKGVDVSKARHVFHEAKTYLAKGRYKRIIEICDKTREIAVATYEGTLGTPAEGTVVDGKPEKIDLAMLSDDELLTMIEIYRKQLKDLEKDGVNMKEAKSLITKSKRALKKGDKPTVINNLNQIDGILASVPNDVWMKVLVKQLKGMVRSKDKKRGDTQFLNEMYDAALEYMQTDNYFEAMKMLRDGQLTTLRKQ